MAALLAVVASIKSHFGKELALQQELLLNRLEAIQKWSMASIDERREAAIAMFPGMPTEEADRRFYRLIKWWASNYGDLTEKDIIDRYTIGLQMLCGGSTERDVRRFVSFSYFRQLNQEKTENTLNPTA